MSNEYLVVLAVEFWKGNYRFNYITVTARDEDDALLKGVETLKSKGFPVIKGDDGEPIGYVYRLKTY